MASHTSANSSRTLAPRSLHGQSRFSAVSLTLGLSFPSDSARSVGSMEYLAAAMASALASEAAAAAFAFLPPLRRPLAAMVTEAGSPCREPKRQSLTWPGARLRPGVGVCMAGQASTSQS